MKNDLTCAVVHDLLPSYVDGLTSAETNEAVARHLDGCADCAERLAAMKAPEETALPAAETKEVDYLKAMRKRRRRSIALAVLCTAFVLCAALFAKVYVIGEPAVLDEVHYAVDVDRNDEIRMSYSVYPYAHGKLTEPSFKQEGDVVYLTLRRVQPHKINPLDSDSNEWTAAAPGVREIYLCGELVWKDGLSIDESIQREYKTAIPYVGDAPGVHRVIETLDPGFGGWTMELQTAAAPYGCIIRFEDPMENWQNVIGNEMRIRAEKMLALIGNLGFVTWTYTDSQGMEHTQTVTLEEVNESLDTMRTIYNGAYGTDWEARESVKAYTDSIYSYTQLTELIGMPH